MKRKRPGIRIDDFDVALFRYLYSVKAALVEQIQRDVYSIKSMEAIWKRLRKLESLGHLQGAYSCHFRNKKILSITSKAFKEFLAQGDEPHVELKSGKVQHDIELVEIRHILKGTSRLTNYLSENDLQTWHFGKKDSPYAEFANVRSDGVIDVKFPNGTFSFALEYEATLKSRPRNEEKLRKCYKSLMIPAFFFICASETIKDSLLKTESERHSNDDSIIYYKTLDDLKTDPTLTFTNRKGKRLQLGGPNETEISVPV